MLKNLVKQFTKLTFNINNHQQLVKNLSSMSNQSTMKYNACMKHPNDAVVFRQLVDNATFTYTYILADLDTREAVIIDPVFEKVERDVELINQLELKLKYARRYLLIVQFIF